MTNNGNAFINKNEEDNSIIDKGFINDVIIKTISDVDYISKSQSRIDSGKKGEKDLLSK